MLVHVTIVFFDYISVFISEYSTIIQRTADVIVFLCILVSTSIGGFLTLEFYRRLTTQERLKKALRADVESHFPDSNAINDSDIQSTEPKNPPADDEAVGIISPDQKGQEWTSNTTSFF